MELASYYKGKKIFLTGHTGFKGSWLLAMLSVLGSEVKGYALAPEKDEDLFNQINGESLCVASVLDDIRNADRLKKEVLEFQPDIIFHLAAQPLVRRSYTAPVYTFETNVLGTIHVMEAMRELSGSCVGVMITTDKVYENNELSKPFQESDKLGGHDPYSSSKAAAEIAIASYRKSFFNPKEYSRHQKSIVAMRAGNVIGGGDFAEDRIIPDIVRAIRNDVAVELRNPHAIRPWQHVLEPLYIYLKIAFELARGRYGALLPAYNIGPEFADVLEVETVTQKFIQYFGKGTYEVVTNPQNPHEAGILMLDNTSVKRDLNWQPQFNAEKAIELTAQWYANLTQSAWAKTEAQIKSYLQHS